MLDQQVPKASLVRKGHRASKVYKEQLDLQDRSVHRVGLDHKVLKVSKGFKGFKGRLVLLAR